MTAALLWPVAALLSIAAASQTPQPGAAEATLRFHHVHYRVADPAAAMTQAADRLSGVRVVVPGLGVGIRRGSEYVLFDRRNDVDSPPSPHAPIGEAYRLAAAWLARQGLRADPPQLAAVQIAAALPQAGYDHVAFAAGDLGAVTRRLQAAGVTPLRADEDAVLFDAGDGLRVEVVRDTDRADTFWCPMHPDVRSPDAGACHLCGMDLVLIPPPKLGEYNLDMTQMRSGKRPGIAGLEIAVRDPESNALVKTFAIVHERRFHFFIVGRDLEYFEHVHPEPAADGTFLLRHAIPPGEYMLLADFLPQGGTSQMVQRALIVAGTTPPASRTRGATPNVRIALKQEDFAAGKHACLTFTITDRGTGAPITDLEPYLGAAAHMLLVRSDLTDAVHAHPEETEGDGSVISFHPLVPAAGDYKLWLQIQRRGQVITVPFVLRAER